MRDRAFKALTLAITTTLVLVFIPAGADAQVGSDGDPKKVLVELYTSQGCDSCPPASDLLGKLAAMGYGPDRIVPLNFHVDYFNTPWEDPFSDPSYSDRQQSYNRVTRRTDLYYTPLMMVDGRYPFLGSNRDKAATALRQARTEAAGVALNLNLTGSDLKKSLAVKLNARIGETAGRDLLIGVALTQDQVSTKVPTGENAGKTLVEYHVVRRLDHKFVKLDRTEPTTLTFPLALPTASDPTHIRVAAFVQDRANGKVYQADAIPWTAAPAGPTTTSR